MVRLALRFALLAVSFSATADGPSPERRAELVNMVRQDCGSCHGLTLKGGLGSPLVPAALAGKDPGQLGQVILHGRPGTAMPPWRDHLTGPEARWIVQQLMQGLPR